MMEEIKAGDIMLGNYIQSPYGNYPIAEIGYKDDDAYIRQKDCHAGYYLSYCRPIPLTEDILLKAGFRKRKMSGYDTHFIYSLFIGGETIGITAIYNADFSIMLHGVARGVKYLHRLQNIIKIITGNELEINL